MRWRGRWWRRLAARRRPPPARKRPRIIVAQERTFGPVLVDQGGERAAMSRPVDEVFSGMWAQMRRQGVDPTRPLPPAAPPDELVPPVGVVRDVLSGVDGVDPRAVHRGLVDEIEEGQ